MNRFCCSLMTTCFQCFFRMSSSFLLSPDVCSFLMNLLIRSFLMQDYLMELSPDGLQK